MDVKDFIKLHGKNGTVRYYNYCEIIITPDGEVYEALPSHQDMMITLIARKFRKTKEQVLNELPLYGINTYLAAKYNLVIVNYEYLCGNRNIIESPKVKHVIDTLKDANMLADNIDNHIAYLTPKDAKIDTVTNRNSQVKFVNAFVNSLSDIFKEN